MTRREAIEKYDFMSSRLRKRIFQKWQNEAGDKLHLADWLAEHPEVFDEFTESIAITR